MTPPGRPTGSAPPTAGRSCTPSYAPAVNSLVQWSEGTAAPALEQLRAALTAGGIVNQVVDDFRDAIGLWT